MAIAIEQTSGLGASGLLYEEPHSPTLSYNPALRKSVSKGLTRAHARATTLLHAHLPALRDLASRLAEARELSRAEIQDWIEGITGGGMGLCCGWGHQKTDLGAPTAPTPLARSDAPPHPDRLPRDLEAFRHFLSALARDAARADHRSGQPLI